MLHLAGRHQGAQQGDGQTTLGGQRFPVQVVQNRKQMSGMTGLPGQKVASDRVGQRESTAPGAHLQRRQLARIIQGRERVHPSPTQTRSKIRQRPWIACGGLSGGGHEYTATVLNLMVKRQDHSLPRTLPGNLVDGIERHHGAGRRPSLHQRRLPAGVLIERQVAHRPVPLGLTA